MSFIVCLGLPFTVANQGRLARAGVACYCRNISGQHRLDFFNQVITEAQLKALYPSEVADIDAQLQNWQAVISASTPPTTQDRYYASGNMTEAQWDRAAALFDSLPAQLRYAKFSRDYTLLATNTTLTVGQKYTEVEALSALGFRFYAPSDLLLKR